MNYSLTRRAALIGALTSTAALAVPAVAAVAPVAEHPWIRARRLFKELSEALAEIEQHPVAGGSHVAIVYPAGHKGGWYADLDYYTDAWSRCITEEQAAAIAAWQLVTIEANAQWDIYIKANDGKPARRHDPDYEKWRSIYARQQDAHLEMTRVFYPKVSA